jgi:hypothetical protein
MYQVLKCREEGSDLGREREQSHTVYEWLFGRLCAYANGIGEEVTLVPTDLGDNLGIEEKSSMSQADMDLRVEPYIPH